MFEQDYLMRIIHEMVRVVLKLLFHIDTESPAAKTVENTEIKNMLLRLQEMADDGQINEAENEMYRMLETRGPEGLEAALLFYAYLNEKDNAFLAEHQYSRNEIKDGLKDVMSQYGLGSVAETLMLGESIDEL